MRLRSARPEDACAIASLWRKSIRTVCAPAYGFNEAVLGPWADEKTPECVAELIVCEEFFIVAEAEDCEIAGFFCGSFALNTFALYVAPERQRTGVGSRLFRCYENLARAEGKTSVTFHSSLNAVTFYQKFGAEICGETVLRPRPCVPMRKDLKRK